MTCINCYISWFQSLLPHFFALLVAFFSFAFLRPAPDRPPSYGPRYLPPFLRGILAAYRIGVDEDAFLQSLREIGEVVYVPWPLGQYFVSDAKLMKEVYETNSKVLAFAPIRKSMQYTTFGSAPSVAFSPLMESQLFPRHAKALTKPKIASSLSQYLTTLQAHIEKLGNRIDQSEDGEVVVGLTEWIPTVLFESSLSALFGPSILSSIGISSTHLHKLFNTFDDSFPLLASEMVPPSLQFLVPPMRTGVKARVELVALMKGWIEGGAEGCDEGVVKDMIELGKEVGWSTEEVAKILISQLWALQANAPMAMCWLLLYVLQSPPTLLSSLHTEFATLSTSSLTLSSLSSLPLAQSLLTETLRTATSSFSIRVVQQSTLIGGRWRVKKGERIICATRCGHLDEKVWENAGMWEGKRFLDEGAEGDGEKRARMKEVHGFGGGISACEGQHLASAEIKAFLALLFTSFDISLVTPSSTSPSLALVGNDDAVRPKTMEGRVGLGLLQFQENDFKLKLRRQTNVKKE